MTEQLVTPIGDWTGLKGCRVSVKDPDTQHWANFIMNNLTKANQEYIQSVLPIMVKLNGWLHEDTAELLNPIVEDRTKALVKAVDAGICQSDKYPTLSYKRERHAVGAAICELAVQGLGSEFINSLRS